MFWIKCLSSVHRSFCGSDGPGRCDPVTLQPLTSRAVFPNRSLARMIADVRSVSAAAPRRHGHGGLSERVPRGRLTRRRPCAATAWPPRPWGRSRQSSQAGARRTRFNPRRDRGVRMRRLRAGAHRTQPTLRPLRQPPRCSAQAARAEPALVAVHPSLAGRSRRRRAAPVPNPEGRTIAIATFFRAEALGEALEVAVGICRVPAALILFPPSLLKGNPLMTLQRKETHTPCSHLSPDDQSTVRQSACRY